MRVLVLALLAGLVVLTTFVLLGLPPRGEVRALAAKAPAKTALMLQREAEARAKKRKPRTVQTMVTLARVSRSLIQAVISSEDQKFFGHEGIDWQAMKESAETNVKRGRAVRGGSTITQQLAKNLYFGTERSLTRKVREAIVTQWLEDDLSKVRILTLYLNLIEWGDGIYGCEAAAQAWFGKPCADLSPHEAAGLAGMIPNPRRINPKVNAARYERARNRVLWLMAHAGYIEKSVSGLGSSPPPLEPELGDEPEPAEATEMPEPAPGAPLPREGTATPGPPRTPPAL